MLYNNIIVIQPINKPTAQFYKLVKPVFSYKTLSDLADPNST